MIAEKETREAIKAFMRLFEGNFGKGISFEEAEAMLFENLLIWHYGEEGDEDDG
ncbi:MAG: hypothetical protein ACRD2L_09760 [Terriglobia bacterium]